LRRLNSSVGLFAVRRPASGSDFLAFLVSTFVEGTAGLVRHTHDDDRDVPIIANDNLLTVHDHTECAATDADPLIATRTSYRPSIFVEGNVFKIRR
jgi:hypothetical protein